MFYVLNVGVNIRRMNKEKEINEDEIMSDKKYTARGLMDELKSIDVRLYEEVLDTISEHYGKELTTGYYAWDDDGEGQIMMYIEDEMNTDSA
mgnify:CR=1 FL=1